MPRKWVTGLGSTPYSLPKRNDYTLKSDSGSEVQPVAEAPAPVEQPTTFQQPVDTYLKGRVVQTDPFGTKTVPSNSLAPLPSPINIHNDPSADVFWNNPSRLDRYVKAFKSAPSGWQAPSGIDPKAIEEAYNEMQVRNGYSDPSTWKPLDVTDPYFQKLASMQLPPLDYMTPEEGRYRAQVTATSTTAPKEPVDFASAPLWQQVLTYLTPEQEGFANTPWGSKGSSATVEGLIAGLGGAGITTLAVGALGLLGIALAPEIAAAAPIVAGVAVGGATMYQNITGNEVPVMSEVLQTFDILTKLAEQGFGVGSQVATEGLKPFVENYAKIKAAAKAGEATYESSDIETINLFAKVLDFIDFNSNYFQVDAENLAKPGESWAFDYGYSKPVENANPEGEAGLKKLRTNIEGLMAKGASDEEIQAEVEKFKATFFSSGGMNDMVFGTVLDPANWVPFMGSLVGERVSAHFDENLSRSFKQSRGNLFIDSLPFGPQQIAESISNTFHMGAHASTGPLSAIEEYKIRKRYATSTMGGGKPAEQYTAVERRAMGLTDQGTYAELKPAIETPKRTGVVGRTIDFLQYLVGLNEESKAYSMLDMFHNSFTQIMNDPEYTPDLKLTMIQKAAGIIPADMNNVSEQFIGSPAMRTISEGFKYALTNGGMDMYRNYKAAEKDFIPWINKVAAGIGMSVDDMAKMYTKDPKKFQNLLDAKKIPGLDTKTVFKRLKDNLSGPSPIPLSEAEMWSRFSQTMYDQQYHYLKKTYALGDDENSIFKTTALLKGVQNIVLLGFSPQYLIENTVGNKVVMATMGILGTMKPDDIRSIMSELGLDPARIGEGYTPAGDVSENFHIAGSEAKGQLDQQKSKIRRLRKGIANYEDGKVIEGERTSLWGKATQTIGGVGKFGIASSLSSKVEAADSLQAYTHALLRFYDNEWKVDRGLRRSPMEKIWEEQHPGMSKFIYSAIESSKNIPQVMAKLFENIGKPNIDDVIKYAAEKTGVDSEILSQTLKSTGLAQKLSDRLDNASTVQEATQAYDDVESALTQHIADTFIRDVKGYAGHVTSAVKAEGVPAILRSHTLTEQLKLTQMLADKSEWDELYSLRNSGSITQGEFGERVKNKFAREAEEWDHVYQKELMTIKGITDALNMESIDANRYIEGVDTISTMWRKFHSDRVQALNTFFGMQRGKSESAATFKARQTEAWEILNSDLDLKYRDVFNKEDDLAALNDEIYISAYTKQTGWKPDVVREWRQAVRASKKGAYEAQAAFRQSLKGMDANAAREAWAKFRPRMNSMLNDLDRIEAEYSVRIMKGTPNANTTSPIIQSVVDDIQSKIATNILRSTATEMVTIDDVLSRELEALGFSNPQIAGLPEEELYRLASESIPAKVLAMMEYADNVKVNPKGKANATAILNITNASRARNGMDALTTLRDAPLNDVLSAINEHMEKHKLDYVAPRLRAALYTQDIAEMASAVERENLIRSLSYRTREEIKQHWKESLKLSDDVMTVTEALMDKRAAEWAISKGYGNTEAARDAFWATNFGTEADVERGPSFKQTGLEDLDMSWALDYSRQYPDPLDFDAWGVETDIIKGLVAGSNMRDEFQSDAAVDDIELLRALYHKTLIKADPTWRYAATEVPYEYTNIEGAKGIATNTTVIPIQKGTYKSIVMWFEGDKAFFGIEQHGMLYRTDGWGKVWRDKLTSSQDRVIKDAQGKTIAYKGNVGGIRPSMHFINKVLTRAQEFKNVQANEIKLRGDVQVKGEKGTLYLVRPKAEQFTIDNIPVKVVLNSDGTALSMAIDTGTFITVTKDKGIEYGLAVPSDTIILLKKDNGSFTSVSLDTVKINNYKGEPALIATHTIPADNLVKTIERFGGIVAPSFSIQPLTVDDRFMHGFDTYDFVLDKSAIERGLEDETITVHNRDAWTGTLPQYETGDGIGIQFPVTSKGWPPQAGAANIVNRLFGRWQDIDAISELTDLPMSPGARDDYNNPVLDQLMNAFQGTNKQKALTRSDLMSPDVRARLGYNNTTPEAKKAMNTFLDRFDSGYLFWPKKEIGDFSQVSTNDLQDVSKLEHDLLNTLGISTATLPIPLFFQNDIECDIYVGSKLIDRFINRYKGEFDTTDMAGTIKNFFSIVGENVPLYLTISRWADKVNENMPGRTNINKLSLMYEVSKALEQDGYATTKERLHNELAYVVTHSDDMGLAPFELRALVDTVMAAVIPSDEFIVELHDGTKKVMNRAEVINTTSTSTGHYYDNNVAAYSRDTGRGFIHGLASLHLNSMDEIRSWAEQNGFGRMPILNELDSWMNDADAGFKINLMDIVPQPDTVRTAIALEFLHFTAINGARVMELSDEQAAQFLNRTAKFIDGTVFRISDYAEVSKDNISVIKREYDDLLPTLQSAKDNSFEGKIKGLMPEDSILYVVANDTSNPNTKARQILKDKGIEVVEGGQFTWPDFIAEAVNRSALFQGKGKTKAKGETEFLQDGRAVIRGLNAPDVSTMVHELGHVFLQTLSYDELNGVTKLGGFQNVRDYYSLRTRWQNKESLIATETKQLTTFEEWFARGFEMYVTQGDAPTPELRSMFTKFTSWMLDIYKRLKMVGSTAKGFDQYKAFRTKGEAINLRAEVNGVSLKSIFDKMLAGSQMEQVPQYYDIVERAMKQIKNSNPELNYRDRLNTAQAKLAEMMDKAIADAGMTVDQFVSSNDTLYLPDGTPLTGDLARQILDAGIVPIKAQETAQIKADLEFNADYVNGNAVPFAQLGLLKTPAYEGGGNDLVNLLAPIPEKGLHVIRIKGFENDSGRFVAAVYSNGKKVAYLPEGFETNVESTINGKKVTILGYDIRDQSQIVYKRGTGLYSIDIPTTPLNKPGSISDPSLQQPADESFGPEAIGNVPMDGYPEPMPVGSALQDLRRDHLQPALNAMRDYTRLNWDSPQNFKMKDVDANTTNQIKQWITSDVSADMGQTKRVASKYGEMRRDGALLNYNQRYGFDDILGLGLPYEMWYTRTMINWAKKMIDKPAWYSMYARIEEDRRKFENIYLPERLKGSVRLPAPWMPSWTGGSIYSDPFRRLFQFSSMAQPLQQFAGINSQLDYAAGDVLSEMVKTGEITTEDKNTAYTTKAGPIWEKAKASAQANASSDMNPLTMAGMMLTPATWWTTPYYLGTGQQEKLSTTPGFRLTQTIKELGKNTAFEPMTDIVGLLGKPEALMREKVYGMDEPTNLFGQYGNYYIQREIANMAIDANISVQDASIAVAQRSGPIWQQALDRVLYQQSLKTPGALPFQAIKSGANPIEVLGSMVAGTFPNSLFPKGEQEYAKIKNQLSMAYDKKEGGDPDALGKFYKDYPVYTLRSLIKESDPQEQLRMVLANEIWGRYNELGGANKRQVRRYLGSEFDKFISDKEYRDMVTAEQLGEWASGLGQKTPSNVEVPAQPAEVPYYTKAQDEEYSQYLKWRQTSYPESYKQSEEYYALPKGSKRAAYLREHPTLQQYFNANSIYKKAHPIVAQINAQSAADYATEGAWYEDSINSLSDPQINQLHNTLLGKPLGTGTIESLKKLYNRVGRKSGLAFEDWINVVANGLNL